MSYRIGQHKPSPDHREVSKLSTPSFVYIDNGDIARIAYPCAYYAPPEDCGHKHKHHHKHDHRHDHRHHERDHHRCTWWDHTCKKCMWFHYEHWTPSACMHCPSHIDERFLSPIHFSKEFPNPDYLELDINFAKKEDGTLVLPGLSATASIDRDYPRDNVIRINFKAECPSAEYKQRETLYSLILKYNDPNDIMRSVALKGKVIVLPTLL